MKKINFLSVVTLAVALIPSLGKAEWQGRFSEGLVPLKISITKPIQIPVPWYGCHEQVSEWGSYDVAGIDIGLEADSDNIYGLSVGGLMWGEDMMAGLDVAIVALRTNTYGLQVGFFNMTEKMRGVQIGVSNTVKKDLKGVQIGLLNFNFGGPLKFFPIVNARF